MSEVGPDGNVWVIDWYNYIVQHNPTPKGFTRGAGNAYETNLRDKKHGRIYRVVHGDVDKPFTLADASPQKLVATLSHPTMLWRKHAQRLLVERGKTDVVDALVALTREPAVDPIGLNVGAIHALWTLHGLGQLDGSNATATAAAFAALKHRVCRCSPQRRAGFASHRSSNEGSAGIRCVGRHGRPSPLGGHAGTFGFTQDGSSRPERFLAAIGDSDRWLADASVSAAATNADSFLAAIAASKTNRSVACSRP